MGAKIGYSKTLDQHQTLSSLNQHQIAPALRASHQSPSTYVPSQPEIEILFHLGILFNPKTVKS